MRIYLLSKDDGANLIGQVDLTTTTNGAIGQVNPARPSSAVWRWPGCAAISGAMTLATTPSAWHRSSCSSGVSRPEGAGGRGLS